MPSLTFEPAELAALRECLARPYPSAHPDGFLAVQPDRSGRPCLVLTDVPTGVAVDPLLDGVADETRNGLLPGLRGIHNEAGNDGDVRIVFTPAVDTDLQRLEVDLRASFARIGRLVVARLAELADAVARQGRTIELPWEDWFVVHLVLADARLRQPEDDAVAAAAGRVERAMGPSRGAALRSRVARAARLRPVRAWLRRL